MGGSTAAAGEARAGGAAAEPTAPAGGHPSLCAVGRRPRRRRGGRGGRGRASARASNDPARCGAPHSVAPGPLLPCHVNVIVAGRRRRAGAPFPRPVDSPLALSSLPVTATLAVAVAAPAPHRRAAPRHGPAARPSPPAAAAATWRVTAAAAAGADGTLSPRRRLCRRPWRPVTAVVVGRAAARVGWRPHRATAAQAAGGDGGAVAVRAWRAAGDGGGGVPPGRPFMTPRPPARCPPHLPVPPRGPCRPPRGGLGWGGGGATVPPLHDATPLRPVSRPPASAAAGAVTAPEGVAGYSPRRPSLLFPLRQSVARCTRPLSSVHPRGWLGARPHRRRMVDRAPPALLHGGATGHCHPPSPAVGSMGGRTAATRAAAPRAPGRRAGGARAGKGRRGRRVGGAHAGSAAVGVGPGG